MRTFFELKKILKNQHKRDFGITLINPSSKISMNELVTYVTVVPVCLHERNLKARKHVGYIKPEPTLVNRPEDHFKNGQHSKSTDTKVITKNARVQVSFKLPEKTKLATSGEMMRKTSEILDKLIDDFHKTLHPIRKTSKSINTDNN